MRSQFVLTLVWLFFFVANLAVLESYVHVTTPEGKKYLVAEDRNEFLHPILTMYGSYISGILAFWFVKPFRPPASESGARARFLIAILCTIIFNGAIVFLLSQSYFLPEGRRDVGADLETAKSLMKWLSFIVAPVNLFYFGSKPSG
jgi:hypothetical protein